MIWMIYVHTMVSVKVGKWWCSSRYFHGRYSGCLGDCHFCLTAIWLCARRVLPSKSDENTNVMSNTDSHMAALYTTSDLA